MVGWEYIMYYVLEGATKTQKKVIDDAMTFVIHFLKIPSHVEALITVSSRFNSCGVILTDIEDGFLSFDMEIIRDISDKELELTIYHEMKHIEQISTGALQDTKWYGRDHENTPYMECPWEIEAYSFEKFAEEMRKQLQVLK